MAIQEEVDKAQCSRIPTMYSRLQRQSFKSWSGQQFMDIKVHELRSFSTSII